MSIQILAIFPKGDKGDERIQFLVIDDCNLGDYVLADDSFKDGKPSNKIRNTYFFPSIEVKKDEVVSLRTMKGVYAEVAPTRGKRKVHRIFWGLEKAVWNDSGDCAHLLFAPRAKRSHKQAP